MGRCGCARRESHITYFYVSGGTDRLVGEQRHGGVDARVSERTFTIPRTKRGLTSALCVNVYSTRDDSSSRSSTLRPRGLPFKVQPSRGYRHPCRVLHQRCSKMIPFRPTSILETASNEEEQVPPQRAKDRALTFPPLPEAWPESIVPAEMS